MLLLFPFEKIDRAYNTIVPGSTGRMSCAEECSGAESWVRSIAIGIDKLSAHLVCVERMMMVNRFIMLVGIVLIALLIAIR